MVGHIRPFMGDRCRVVCLEKFLLVSIIALLHVSTTNPLDRFLDKSSETHYLNVFLKIQLLKLAERHIVLHHNSFVAALPISHSWLHAYCVVHYIAI